MAISICAYYMKEIDLEWIFSLSESGFFNDEKI